MTQYYIGVDLHKSVAQICVLDGQGEIQREWRAKLRRPEDGMALIATLAAIPEARIAVEALGCNRWFVNGARAKNLDVLVVHAAALGLKKSGRKTDRRDAAEIARRLYLGDLDRHAKSYYAPDEEYGPRKMLRTLKVLGKHRQKVINQIRSLLNAYLVLPPSDSLDSKRAVDWLRKVKLPTTTLTTSLQVFVTALAHVREQIRLLEKEVKELGKVPDVEVLVANLPSIQVRSAAVMHYELGDVHRFRRTKEAVSYVGVTPRVNQSGDGAAHHGPMDKRGNPHLRWIFSQWAVRLLASTPQARQWAERYRTRLHPNKIRMALVRRLVIGVVHMKRTGEVFSLERCLALETAPSRVG